MAKSRRKRTPKTVLKLPDLEQSKSAVLNSLTLSLPKMPSGGNGFEISDMKKMKVRPRQIGDENVTMLHGVENR
jgi:hypothetical protein